MTDTLITYLEEFITPERKQLFDRVIQNRTRYITVVLEDIFQPHNASAVLRSCDCFGIQDVHIIENRNKYQVNPDVTLGSDKWLSLIKYNKQGNNSTRAIKELRKKGYRIVATTPHNNDTELNNFDVSMGKIALFFGTELQGLSEDVLQNADEFLKIPMYGFTESYNISVSAAIILYTLTEKMKASVINWQLTKEEMRTVRKKWLERSVRNSNLIEKEYINKKISK